MARMKHILEAVCEYYEVDSKEVVKSKRQFQELVDARHMFYFIAHALEDRQPSKYPFDEKVTNRSKYSTTRLARYIGHENHSSVVKAVQKIRGELELGITQRLEDIKAITVDIMDEPMFYKRAKDIFLKKQEILVD